MVEETTHQLYLHQELHPALSPVYHKHTYPPAATTLPTGSVTMCPASSSVTLKMLSGFNVYFDCKSCSAQTHLFFFFLFNTVWLSLYRVRSTPLKQSPGYQVELVIQLVWVSGEPPQQITSLAVNSAYGL